jgi:hypothetical protein
MDKVTLDAVMEEIKKSLGEARLMKIFEDDPEKERYDDKVIKPPEPKAPETANNANDEKGNGAVATPAEREKSTQAAAAPTGTPAAQSPETKASPQDRANFQSKAIQGDTKASPADRDAFRARTGSTVGATPAATPAAAGRGAGGPSLSDKSALAAAATNRNSSGPVSKPAARPSAPAAAKPATPAAAPASGGNKYGYAASGSDDDNAANFFAASKRETADRASQAAPAPSARPAAPAPRPAAPAPRPAARPAAPAPNLSKVTPGSAADSMRKRYAPGGGGSAGNTPMVAENFDQFVKKFLKESK